MKRWLSLSIIACLMSPVSMAYAANEPEAKDAAKKNEISEILDSMGYPELQVVPHASERLSIEAKMEDNSAYVTHWPIELSGLVTMAVGLTARSNKHDNLTDKQNSDADVISTVATGVGLGWVLGGALIGLERPYRTGVSYLNKYPGKDERSSLLRERLAEESLERPARTMRMLEYIAVISMVTVNIAAAYHSNETGVIMGGVGAVTSFLPFIFEDHSIGVYDKQMEYKRKIYTPIKSASFHYEATNKSFTPMTNLTWYF